MTTQSPEVRNHEQKKMLRAGYLARVTGRPDPYALHQLVSAIKSWRSRNAEKALMAQRMDAAFGRTDGGGRDLSPMTTSVARSL